MKLFLFILLSFAWLIGHSQEAAQCQIQIDQSNSKVYQNNEGQYIFKSIVRHEPPFGNDDDAHQVDVRIRHDESLIAWQIRASVNDIPIPTTSITQISNEILIKVAHIPRADYTEVEIKFQPKSPSCIYQFTISAWPKRPRDIKPSDNQHTITIDNCKEDCIPFNTSAMNIIKEGNSRYLITDGTSRMMILKSQKAANQALNTIKHYLLDTQCFCKRPQPGLQYYKSKKKIPKGSLAGEDCIPISSPMNLEIRENSSNSYSIIDKGGNNTPFHTKSREEATNIIALIKKHRAKYTCFIERPNPGMVYLRK